MRSVELAAFFEAHPRAIVAELGSVRGSAPREQGAFMVIAADATIGTIGNLDHQNVRLGKAGRKRNMGIRPTVRGSVMNPNDHPHGGGEGRAPIGRSGPVTPWGKPALGYKTRKKTKASDKYIVRRRNAK